MVSTTAVAQALRGLSFPCSKRDCIEHARRHDAPGDLIGVLERMPERRFQSMADVWSAIGEVS